VVVPPQSTAVLVEQIAEWHSESGFVAPIDGGGGLSAAVLPEQIAEWLCGANRRRSWFVRAALVADPSRQWLCDATMEKSK
jgi:hypothetical protein